MIVQPKKMFTIKVDRSLVRGLARRCNRPRHQIKNEQSKHNCVAKISEQQRYYFHCRFSLFGVWLLYFPNFHPLCNLAVPIRALGFLLRQALVLRLASCRAVTIKLESVSPFPSGAGNRPLSRIFKNYAARCLCMRRQLFDTWAAGAGRVEVIQSAFHRSIQFLRNFSTSSSTVGRMLFCTSSSAVSSAAHT